MPRVKIHSKSARDYIQEKMIAVAKYRTTGTRKTVNEIAYELGFNTLSNLHECLRKLLAIHLINIEIR